MTTIAVRLYVFAYLRDVFSVDQETRINLSRVEWSSSEELKSKLLEELHRLPNKNGILPPKDIHTVRPESIMLALNEEFIQPGERVRLVENDVLALIPPVSGG